MNYNANNNTAMDGVYDGLKTHKHNNKSISFFFPSFEWSLCGDALSAHVIIQKQTAAPHA